MEDIKNILTDIMRIFREKYIMVILLILPLYIVGSFYAICAISLVDGFISITGLLFLNSRIIANTLSSTIVGFSICLPIFFDMFRTMKYKRVQFHLTLLVISWIIGNLVGNVFIYIIKGI